MSLPQGAPWYCQDLENEMGVGICRDSDACHSSGPMGPSTSKTVVHALCHGHNAASCTQHFVWPHNVVIALRVRPLHSARAPRYEDDMCLGAPNGDSLVTQSSRDVSVALSGSVIGQVARSGERAERSGTHYCPIEGLKSVPLTCFGVKRAFFGKACGLPILCGEWPLPAQGGACLMCHTFSQPRESTVRRCNHFVQVSLLRCSC